MIKITKPTRKEAIRAHLRVINYSYKSGIRPRLGLLPPRIDWVFKYIPSDDIDKENIDKLNRLNWVYEDWNIMIEDLKKRN